MKRNFGIKSSILKISPRPEEAVGIRGKLSLTPLILTFSPKGEKDILKKGEENILKAASRFKASVFQISPLPWERAGVRGGAS